MEQLLGQRLPEHLPDLAAQELQARPIGRCLTPRCRPPSTSTGLLPAWPGRRRSALQLMLEQLMNQLLNEAEALGLQGSFFLHVAPNLGRNPDGTERIKPPVAGDVGTPTSSSCSPVR